MKDYCGQVDKKIAVLHDFLHIFLCTASYKADLWPFSAFRNKSTAIYPLNPVLFALLRESLFARSGSTLFFLLEKSGKGFERFGTDMMLDALSIQFSRTGADTDCF